MTAKEAREIMDLTPERKFIEECIRSSVKRKQCSITLLFTDAGLEHYNEAIIALEKDGFKIQVYKRPSVKTNHCIISW